MLGRIRLFVGTSGSGVLLAAVGAFLFFYSNPAPADTPISWTPVNAVNVTVFPGGQTETEASFIALRDLGNIYIHVVPEIDPYVDVTPTTVDNVSEGDVVLVRITAAAPPSATADLLYGTIQVREQVQRRGHGRVLPRPLSVQVLIQEDQGVLGADNDGNGIWDYIEEYINATFPGPEKADVRNAAKQFAQAIQGGLINASDKSLSLRFATDSDRATECMYSVITDGAYDALSNLEAAILNNKARSLAFLMFSEQSAGQVFQSTPYSQRGASCEDGR